MKSNFVAFALVCLITAGTSSTTFAQSRRSTSDIDVSSARPLTAAPKSVATTSVAGSWVYRSYRNRPDVIVGDDADSACKAMGLLFGEGVIDLNVAANSQITGTFDMGGGYILDLTGTASGSSPSLVALVGVGRAGTPTAGWEYDYNGQLGYAWPTGIDQVPAIVGTVIRAKPHGTAKAGYVASFIAVKRP